MLSSLWSKVGAVVDLTFLHKVDALDDVLSEEHPHCLKLILHPLFIDDIVKKTPVAAHIAKSNVIRQKERGDAQFRRDDMEEMM